MKIESVTQWKESCPCIKIFDITVDLMELGSKHVLPIESSKPRTHDNIIVPRLLPGSG